MGDTGLRAGHPEKKLKRTIDHHEHRRAHRNRRKQGHDHAGRETACKRQQDTEQRAGRADRGVIGTRACRDDELDASCKNGAD